jgi:hypothetical protein
LGENTHKSGIFWLLIQTTAKQNLEAIIHI